MDGENAGADRQKLKRRSSMRGIRTSLDDADLDNITTKRRVSFAETRKVKCFALQDSQQDPLEHNVEFEEPCKTQVDSAISPETPNDDTGDRTSGPCGDILNISRLDANNGEMHLSDMSIEDEDPGLVTMAGSEDHEKDGNDTDFVLKSLRGKSGINPGTGGNLNNSHLKENLIAGSETCTSFSGAASITRIESQCMSLDDSTALALQCSISTSAILTTSHDSIRKQNKTTYDGAAMSLVGESGHQSGLQASLLTAGSMHYNYADDTETSLTDITNQYCNDLFLLKKPVYGISVETTAVRANAAGVAVTGLAKEDDLRPRKEKLLQVDDSEMSDVENEDAEIIVRNDAKTNVAYTKEVLEGELNMEISSLESSPVHPPMKRSKMLSKSSRSLSRYGSEGILEVSSMTMIGNTLLPGQSPLVTENLAGRKKDVQKLSAAQRTFERPALWHAEQFNRGTEKKMNETYGISPDHKLPKTDLWTASEKDQRALEMEEGERELELLLIESRKNLEWDDRLIHLSKNDFGLNSTFIEEQFKSLGNYITKEKEFASKQVSTVSSPTSLDDKICGMLRFYNLDNAFTDELIKALERRIIDITNLRKMKQKNARRNQKLELLNKKFKFVEQDYACLRKISSEEVRKFIDMEDKISQLKEDTVRKRWEKEHLKIDKRCNDLQKLESHLRKLNVVKLEPNERDAVDDRKMETDSPANSDQSMLFRPCSDSDGAMIVSATAKRIAFELEPYGNIKQISPCSLNITSGHFDIRVELSGELAPIGTSSPSLLVKNFQVKAIHTTSKDDGDIDQCLQKFKDRVAFLAIYYDNFAKFLNSQQARFLESTNSLEAMIRERGSFSKLLILLLGNLCVCCAEFEKNLISSVAVPLLKNQLIDSHVSMKQIVSLIEHLMDSMQIN